MHDLYTIDTPENIEFAYDIAGIGSRFLAAIIDTILIVVAIVVVLFIGGVVLSSLEVNSALSSVLIGLGALVIFAFLWGYYIAFEMLWNGQTPGKRAIGLRVVREGGRPITFVSSAIRNFIRFIDFLPSFYGIGVVTMFIDYRARRLGDLAAGTLVVKERRGVTLDSLVAPSAVPLVEARPGEPIPQPTLQNIHLVDEHDYTLVQEFLRRREELGREARARLAVQIAGGLQSRLGLPQGGDAERFLQHVAAEYQLLRRQEASP